MCIFRENRNAHCTSLIGSGVVVCFSHQSPSSLVALWSDSALLVGQLFRGGLQEADKRDSPAGGTERERGCWDCLLHNCSQFAGVLHRNTRTSRTFTSLGGGWNVGRVSKWSAVETCTFVLLCGVIVVAAVAAGGCSTGDRC